MNNRILNVRKLLDQKPEANCIVVGDIILDKYIFGDVGRISPEAPIPVVHVEGEKYVLGGAANVAGNICGYKCTTVFNKFFNLTYVGVLVMI